MSNKEELIRKIITDYESGKIQSEDALNNLNSLTTLEVDLDWLNNYVCSMSLEDFVKLLSIEEISNWQTIDDEKALQLLCEVIENLGDQSILRRNSIALEKRYSKPEGRVSTLIYHKDITDPDELLRLLKIDTTIYL